MPRLTIDNVAVDVPAGSSILDAARQLGIDIPSLCHRDGYHPATACMLCLVRVLPSERLVPSCATPAEDGMQVLSETPIIRDVRRAGLELLLSDHAGDCIAPCQTACPTGVDVPAMLRQVAAGAINDAIVTIRRDLALPAVLGRVCDNYCENACRRGRIDRPASICMVKRFVADTDLASGDPYVPARAVSTGKTVAIVGAGPAGLSAAYHLLIAGHACTIFDERPAAGGMLRYDMDEHRLPRDVLDAEIAIIGRLAAAWRFNTCVGRDISLADLRQQYDVVLIALGDEEGVIREAASGGDEKDVIREAASGVRNEKGVRMIFSGAEGKANADAVILPRINVATHETGTPGVFVAGDVLRPGRVAVRTGRGAVRAVADGKAAAESIHAYLTTGKPASVSRPFSVRMGRLDEGELAAMAADASACETGTLSVMTGSTPVAGGQGPQVRDSFGGKAGGQEELPPSGPTGAFGTIHPDPVPPKLSRTQGPRGGLTAEQARAEAARCLHCDCGARDGCRLRRYAAAYGASATRYRGRRRAVVRQLRHGEVTYEPGKCILCGLCVQVAEAAGEELGLTFIGRGFDVRVGVPFDRPFSEALKWVARQCVDVCPSGALVRMDGQACEHCGGGSCSPRA